MQQTDALRIKVSEYHCSPVEIFLVNLCSKNYDIIEALAGENVQ